MLLQAFDFYHLRKEVQCELQIGGSDQWGNITAGMELTRKKMGVSVFGLTVPLILNADGTKFGKSVAGAVWLNPAKTSVYRFYQFWIRADDRDAVRYLKLFTFLSREEIDALAEQHAARPEGRAAHKALAKAMTDFDPRPQRHGGGFARERDPFWRRIGRDHRGDLCGNCGRSPERDGGAGETGGRGDAAGGIAGAGGLVSVEGGRRERTSRAGASMSIISARRARNGMSRRRICSSASICCCARASGTTPS